MRSNLPSGFPVTRHFRRWLQEYLDNGVMFTQANQLWRGLSGIFTLVLIPLLGTKEQQGYWFTMTSLARARRVGGPRFFSSGHFAVRRP